MKLVGFVLSGFFGAVAVTMLAMPCYVNWQTRGRWLTLCRHLLLAKGTDPRRTILIAVVLSAPLIALGIVAGWNSGVRVDEGGITWSTSFMRVEQASYAEVSSIGLYGSVDAPIGRVNRANLQVTFEDRSAFQLDLGRGDGNMPRLREIAEYVSEKRGVDIIRGDVRP